MKKLCIFLAVLVLAAAFMLHRHSIPGTETFPSVETTETVLQPTTAETTLPETIPSETEPAETDPPKVTVDAVPQYYQNDYPQEPYGTGTVASSGSSMTALAMVATYMTDFEYLPDKMADMLAHFQGNSYQRLEYGNDLLQLSWKRAENVHEAVRAVQEDKTVIVMFHGENLFTWKEHYIVLTGMNESGNIAFLDTDRSHAEKQWLMKHLEAGITEKDLLRGYSCAWIYDKKSMPEGFAPYEPEPPAEACRYPDIALTPEDKRLMANLIYMEAASEPFEGQQAVAEVILNRLKSGRFQSSVHNIIHAPEQFAAAPYLYMAQPDYTQYKAIEQAMYGPYVLPEDVVFYAKFKMNDNLWGKIGNHYFCYRY